MSDQPEAASEPAPEGSGEQAEQPPAVTTEQEGSAQEPATDAPQEATGEEPAPEQAAEETPAENQTAEEAAPAEQPPATEEPSTQQDGEQNPEQPPADSAEETKEETAAEDKPAAVEQSTEQAEAGESTEKAQEEPAATEEAEQPTENAAAEEPAAQTTEEPEAQTNEEPAAQTTEEPEAQTTGEPAAQTTEEPEAQNTEEPAAQTTEEPEAQNTEEPEAQTTEEPAAETAEEPAAQTTEEPAAETMEEPEAQTTDEPAVEEPEEQETSREEELEMKPDQGDVTTEVAGTGPEPGAQPEADVDPHAPSPDNGPPTSRYDNDATATVKFVLMPSGQVATLRCHLGQTLRELREHFSNELKMSADVLVLLFDGRNLADGTTLGDLGVGPNGTVRLEIQSADPMNNPMKPFKPRQEYHMPDVITVKVPTGFSQQTADPTGFMDVVVEIERSTRKKPFLGGYRHKETGVEYHHASAQTMQKQPAGSSVEKFCRDTQTSQQRHIFQQTTNSTSTQMTKIGVYVTNMSDKLVTPGKYTTADEHNATRLDNVILIQKYYRRWLARRYVDKVRVDKSRRQEWEREEEARKKREKEERIKREFERRMNPKTKEDFDLLYHALEKWRAEEVGRINAELTGAERKAALCQLLEQETQLIASVGRHKLEADAENRKLTVQKFLEKAAAPKRWRGPDGKMTEMDTPYTIRAQQMRDIYNSINMKYLTQDERLDVLLTLKHTVKEHDCKLTQEIIELIDREADLLMRGVKEASLEGLRKRISTLFMQYIKTPTFNPEAARLIKVPQDPSTLRRNIYFCSSCNQYLPSTEFQLSSNSRAVGTCRNCSKTDNDARVRQDYSHYRFLLKNLRRQEDAYGDGSKIAFLLQENDLRHLVENVWNSQSILSAWDDLYDLTLVRWIRTEEWSPWNCILLTKEEASAHEKLENLEEAYGKVFIHRVKHKHTLARNYFSRLPGMAEHMRARAASSTLSNRQGPSVSGKSLTSVPASAIKAQ